MKETIIDSFQTEQEKETPDPVKLLMALHESGHGLSREIADAYVEEVYESRKD